MPVTNLITKRSRKPKIDVNVAHVTFNILISLRSIGQGHQAHWQIQDLIKGGSVERGCRKRQLNQGYLNFTLVFSCVFLGCYRFVLSVP